MEWSGLPSELLVTIAGNLTEFTDHIRFRSVCSHWRSAFRSLPVPSPLPWLLLPSDSSSHFYSFSEDRVYTIPLPLPLPLAGSSILLGSASGSLLAVKNQNRKLNFSLINPFDRAVINLPSPNPRSSLSYVVADTLVWDNSDSIVVAACSTRNGVFSCHHGEESWTQIESMKNGMAKSIVFYKTMFYILQAYTCEVIVLDGETLEEILLINPPNLDSPVDAHLFVSSEELLLLVKSNWMELFPESESPFYKVYQKDLNLEDLEELDELEEWREVSDIGDRAIFLDELHCFSVEIDGKSRLKRNCVYSARSRRSGGSRDSSSTCSISLFDLGTSNGECVEGALNWVSVASLRGETCPPTWIMPSFELNINC